MKKVISAAVLAGLLGVSRLAPAQASNPVLDPKDKCSVVLKFDGPFDDEAVIFWTFGYLTAITGKQKSVEKSRAGKILKALKALCDEKPNAAFGVVVGKLAAIINKSKKNKSAGPDAASVVKKFLAPGADYARLTASIKPTERDIQTVFSEPLATNLSLMYQRLFKPGVKIKPKPEHDDYIVIQSTTGKLKAGDPILRKFAGGQKKVRRFYLKNVPIARFKFVRSGEKLGLSFDSLYFVNGRWVLMPKPWRGLKN